MASHYRIMTAVSLITRFNNFARCVRFLPNHSRTVPACCDSFGIIRSGTFQASFPATNKQQSSSYVNHDAVTSQLCSTLRPNNERVMESSLRAGLLDSQSTNEHGYPMQQSVRTSSSTSHATTADPLVDDSHGTSQGGNLVNPVSFTHESVAYATSPQLMRAIAVLAVCQIRPLVIRGEYLIKLMRRLCGQRVTHFLLKKSFYDHFCGGETFNCLQCVIGKLRERNVGVILDYAAEKDVEDAEMDWHAYADQNMSIFLEAIDNTLNSRDPACEREAFIAAKVSSLCPPEVLEAGSSIIRATRQAFADLVGVSTPDGHQFILESDVMDKMVSRAAFIDMMQDRLAGVDEPVDLDALFSQMHHIGLSGVPDAACDNDSIKYFQWMYATSPFHFGWTLNKTAMLAMTRNSVMPLTESGIHHMERCQERLDVICVRAAQTKVVGVLVDAERMNIQQVIDMITSNLQTKHNKTSAVVYNTHQAYLKSAMSSIRTALLKSQILHYILGVKLVRGAYLESEAAAAEVGGYRTPVNSSLEETNRMYDACAEMLITSPQNVHLVLGTHNQHSVVNALKVMNCFSSTPKLLPIYFGQLYRMSDHITMSITRSGYKGYKYIPYGPVDEVMPYLLRRAVENSQILSNSKTEMMLMLQQLAHRMKHACGFA